MRTDHAREQAHEAAENAQVARQWRRPEEAVAAAQAALWAAVRAGLVLERIETMSGHAGNSADRYAVIRAPVTYAGQARRDGFSVSEAELALAANLKLSTEPFRAWLVAAITRYGWLGYEAPPGTEPSQRAGPRIFAQGAIRGTDAGRAAAQIPRGEGWSDMADEAEIVHSCGARLHVERLKRAVPAGAKAFCPHCGSHDLPVRDGDFFLPYTLVAPPGGGPGQGNPFRTDRPLSTRHNHA